MKYLRGILLPALLALTSCAAAKDTPTVEQNTFDNEVVNLFYFDDSEVALLAEFENGIVWRSANAGRDWKKTEVQTLGIMKNPFDNKVAIAIGLEKKHYITYDQAESWQEFELEKPPAWMVSPVSFHATDSKKILFHTFENCRTAPCLGGTYYTEDGFKSNAKVLREDRKMCIWAKSSATFQIDNKDLDSRTLCITKGKYSDRTKDFRILVSDDYFNKDEHEPTMSSGRTVQGMANMASVTNYLVAAAKSDHSNELSLYVTDDTKTWHQAEFGEGKVEEDAYTILESTNYSIQVDVMTSRRAFMGSLYTSNSNGTYFTKNIDHTNRGPDGFVDFEKISGIQGVVMVNVVDNYDKVDSPLSSKRLKSQISFDDGRTFEALKVKKSDKQLHLHSVTNMHNSGRVFSSPAPGLVMGIGNTGDYLGKYTDGDLYVSDDAGLTWELALEEAHKYEFGDQGSVLVAVFDEGETDKVMYSLKHGRRDTWKEIKLDSKIRAHELTTVPDSTSLKFILSGSRNKKGGGREFVLVHLDFAGLHESTCKDGDLEKWPARVDEKGEATCVMGHKQYYRRRKWDAECFVGNDFKEPLPEFEKCDCDELRDYECDFNFKPSGSGKDKQCVPSGALSLPEGACQGDAKKYKGSSGWRKIPGNECKGTTKKDEEQERDCEEGTTPPASGKISAEITTFKGSNFREYYYLERGPNTKGTDETVVVLTSEREVYITHDHGKKWKKAVDDQVVAIFPHLYNNDYVYFLTPSKKVYYSEDRGLRDSIHSFDAPQMPNTEMIQYLQFHPNESDWLIWTGGEHCEKANDRECHTIASVTRNNGAKWEPMLPYVKKCAFAWREEGQVGDDQMVFCEQYTKEEMGAPLQLLSSTDWFDKKEVRFESVVEFATMSEFILVATKGEDGKSLKLDASLDGATFADAKFPPKFEVNQQTAYTVLDSSTHSVFLHVTVNPRPDQEYGAIIKSNSNGTSYVLSINNVNRNTEGYVDFEKMQGIEGVALVNVVNNADAVNGGAKKEKKTYITHNDGADWELLQAPAQDADGKSFGCDVSDKSKCSLHIHGYTERGDPRETFSSPTAVGIMMGVGNVGKELGTFGESSTFITTDAGISWREVKKGNYGWEFGDQGSIIVIVRRGEDVDHLYYSLNSGESWDLYKFADHAVRVDAISTVPSDTSLNFLLWGKDKTGLVAINVDFSGLDEFQKKCTLNKESPTSDDYTLWTPQHPLLDDQQCLFGHEAQYFRKKRDVKCYNGERIDHLANIARNCSCTRRDFECDYNYERMPGGECKLITGLSLPDPKDACKKKGVREYWDITGYRKIPLSTCTGGQEMDHTSTVHPCPGFEDEFQKKHGIGGFGVFLAVVIPFAIAGGVGWWVYKNWDGKFGRIRLGGDGYSGLGSSSSGESPFIKYPVMLVSGVVAVVAALPLLAGSVWRMIGGDRWTSGGGFGGRSAFGGQRFTSRSDFGRSRGAYVGLEEDEGELLGEESDEDV